MADPTHRTNPTKNTVSNGKVTYSSSSHVERHVLSTSPDKIALLDALSKQLVYYFSPANLQRDAYLNAIMNLNSGCVPVDILSNFFNIKRIFYSFQSQYPLMDEYAVIQDLVCQAALGTDEGRQYLRVLVIDQFGRFVANFDENYAHIQGHFPRLAIGPSLATAAEFPEEVVRVENPSKGLTESNSSKTNVIILRDVSEQATEDDIRSVFIGQPAPIIVSVHKDIEHCWFVTLDPKTSQDDLFSMLLSLRSKNILGQPVKARFKTQILAPSIPPETNGAENSQKAGMGLETFSPTPAIKGRRTSGNQDDLKSSVHVDNTTLNNYGNKNHHAKQHQNHTNESHGLTRRPIGGKGTGRLHKNKPRHNRSTRNSVGASVTDEKDSHQTKESDIALLSLVDENFPSLNRIDSGGIQIDHNSDATPIGAKKDPTDTSSSVSGKALAPVSKQVGGYAAALLKPVIVSSSPPSSAATAPTSDVTNLSMSAKQAGNGNTSTVSSGTATTDDCSSDDKSMSSRPESDKSTCNNTASMPCPSTTTMTSTVWSRNGKSFADVLKDNSEKVAV